MKAIITSIFGTYEPLLDPVTGSVVAGVSGVDWVYLAGVFVFGIVLYCFLRMIGTLIKSS